jgi:hypothetical protein
MSASQPVINITNNYTKYHAIQRLQDVHKIKAFGHFKQKQNTFLTHVYSKTDENCIRLIKNNILINLIRFAIKIYLNA